MKNKHIEVPPLLQKERKHSAIINAAREIFFKNGFATTSMDEIAKVANVSKRTVYQHFTNKEKLFQAILVEHWGLVFSVYKPIFDDSKPLAENLIYFASIFMNFLYKPATIDLFRLLISESQRFPDLLDSFLVDENAPFRKELIIFLDKNKKKYQLEINDTERASAYFMGALKEYHFWPMMLGFTKSPHPKNKIRLISEVVELFVKAHTK